MGKTRNPKGTKKLHGQKEKARKSYGSKLYVHSVEEREKGKEAERFFFLLPLFVFLFLVLGAACLSSLFRSASSRLVWLTSVLSFFLKKPLVLVQGLKSFLRINPDVASLVVPVRRVVPDDAPHSASPVELHEAVLQVDR